GTPAMTADATGSIATATRRGQSRRPAATIMALNEPQKAAGANAAPRPEERIVREPECRRRTGLSKPTRWRMERRGEFPRRRRISPGCSGWLESELAAWLADRAAT